MQRELYPDVETMLSPDSLSRLEGRSIHQVRQTPLQSVDSFSGSQLLKVETNDGQGQRYVLKRVRADLDWIMRATEDHQCRAVVAWQTGLLDGLPPDITHGVIACAQDAPGWAILMQDFSGSLIPSGDTPISIRDNEHFLDAMAAMHATFWERPELADVDLGFARLRHHYDVLTLATGHREMGDPSPIPRMIVEGWAVLEQLLEPAVFDVLRTLVDDLQPLCDALASYPQTVVHGDFKLGNLGLLPGARSQVVLLDWAFVGAAPPGVDLAWYLAVNSARLPVSREETIASYRRSLERRLGARFSEEWWQPQLQLSLLGGFLQLGWAKALGAAHGGSDEARFRERAELAWWSEQARKATRWL